MPKILSIETSTALCSVALGVEGKCVALRRDEDRRHASLTALFCDEVLRESGLKASDLDAVCISEGPGSYTGLRVGLSTAKGLCLGSEARLLSICSLDILAAMGSQIASPGQIIIPMIDARRMEVYCAEYNAASLERNTDVQAVVVEDGSFGGIAANSIFIGDGAVKCKDVIGAGRFEAAYPEASAMVSLAEKEYAAGNFRDIAYFTPFYLKDFTVTVSKKKLF